MSSVPLSLLLDTLSPALVLALLPLCPVTYLTADVAEWFAGPAVAGALKDSKEEMTVRDDCRVRPKF